MPRQRSRLAQPPNPLSMSAQSRCAAPASAACRRPVRGGSVQASSPHSCAGPGRGGRRPDGGHGGPPGCHRRVREGGERRSGGAGGRQAVPDRHAAPCERRAAARAGQHDAAGLPAGAGAQWRRRVGLLLVGAVAEPARAVPGRSARTTRRWTTTTGIWCCSTSARGARWRGAGASTAGELPGGAPPQPSCFSELHVAASLRECIHVHTHFSKAAAAYARQPAAGDAAAAQPCDGSRPCGPKLVGVVEASQARHPSAL